MPEGGRKLLLLFHAEGGKKTKKSRKAGRRRGKKNRPKGTKKS